jgi:hypothetical protein
MAHTSDHKLLSSSPEHRGRDGVHDGWIFGVFEVPMVGHPDAIKWRTLGTADFEDALQVAAAIAGHADIASSRET